MRNESSCKQIITRTKLKGKENNREKTKKKRRQSRGGKKGETITFAL